MACLANYLCTWNLWHELIICCCSFQNPRNSNMAKTLQHGTAGSHNLKISPAVQGHISRRNSLAASRVTPSTRMWPLRPGHQIERQWGDTGENFEPWIHVGFMWVLSQTRRIYDDSPWFTATSWGTEFEILNIDVSLVVSPGPGFRSRSGWYEEMLGSVACNIFTNQWKFQDPKIDML